VEHAALAQQLRTLVAERDALQVHERDVRSATLAADAAREQADAAQSALEDMRAQCNAATALLDATKCQLLRVRHQESQAAQMLEAGRTDAVDAHRLATHEGEPGDAGSFPMLQLLRSQLGTAQADVEALELQLSHASDEEAQIKMELRQLEARRDGWIADLAAGAAEDDGDVPEEQLVEGGSGGGGAGNVASAVIAHGTIAAAVAAGAGREASGQWLSQLQARASWLAARLSRARVEHEAAKAALEAAARCGEEYRSLKNQSALTRSRCCASHPV
jgi:regulator of replication initiation timing